MQLYFSVQNAKGPKFIHEVIADSFRDESGCHGL